MAEEFEGIVDPFANEFEGVVDPFAEDKPDGFIDAGIGGIKNTLGALRNTFNVYTGDNADVLAQSVESAARDATPAQEAFMREVQTRSAEGDEGLLDGIKNVVGAAVAEPQGAFHEMVAQLPNSGVALGAMGTGAAIGSTVGGPVGAIAGGILGMFAGNTALETGFAAQEKAQDGDFTDEERSQAAKQGAIKGGVITGVDAATLGLSRAIMGAPGRAVERAVTDALKARGVNVASEEAVRQAAKMPAVMNSVTMAGARALRDTMSRAQRLGRNGVAFSLETASEGAGEFLGSKAAGLEASPTDAVMESLMSMPQSAAEMAVAKNLTTRGENTRRAGLDPDSLDVDAILGAGSVDEAINAAEAGLQPESAPETGTPDPDDGPIHPADFNSNFAAGTTQAEPRAAASPLDTSPSAEFQEYRKWFESQPVDRRHIPALFDQIRNDTFLKPGEADALIRELSERTGVDAPEDAAPADPEGFRPQMQPMGQQPTEQPEQELVDEADLSERTRADIAGAPEDRATLITLSNFIDAWTDSMNDGGAPPELVERAQDLRSRIIRELSSNTDETTRLSSEAAAEIDDWLKDADVDADVTTELRALQERLRVHEQIDAQAGEAATSPDNDLPAPSEAQIEAGNYKKGHIRIHGLDISVENPRGSKRSGVDPDGNEWSVDMAHHYGYIRRTEGADGEHVDVFVGPNPGSQRVYIVDQVNKDGSFDEHKALVGFNSRDEAVEGYKANYDNDRQVGPVTEMSMEEFKGWLENGDGTQPLAPDLSQSSQESQADSVEPRPLLKSDGKPFASEKSARASKHFRDNDGAVVRPHEGGYAVFVEGEGQSGRRDLGSLMRGEKPVDVDTVTGRERKKGWREIGKNHRGETLFEDENGMRSYVDRGIRITESVEIIPGRGAAVNPAERGREYLTDEERQSDDDPRFNPKPTKAAESANRESVEDRARKAWEIVAADYPYPDVPIAEVYAKVGDDMESFKTALKKAAKEGRVVFGGGDWSLSTPEERAAAVTINGRPHLRIRFVDAEPQPTETEEAEQEGEGPTDEERAAGYAMLAPGTILRAREMAESVTGQVETIHQPDENDGRYQAVIRWRDNGKPRRKNGNGAYAYISEFFARDGKLFVEDSHGQPPREWEILQRPEKEPRASGGGAGPRVIVNELNMVDEYNKDLPDGYELRDDGDSLSLHKGDRVIVDGLSRTNGFEEALRLTQRDEQKSKPAAKQQTPSAKQKPKVSKNKIFTDDAAEKAREVLREKLKNQLRTGIDPKILQAGVTLAGWHIEKGARTFAAYAQAMVEDLGEGVKPYLKSWYMGVKYDPRAAEFDGMDSAATVENFDLDTLGAEPAGDLVEFLEQRIGDIRDNRDLKAAMAEFRGVPASEIEARDMKEAQEAMEAALVKQARATVEQGGTDREIYDRLVEQYQAQPNLNVRSSTSMENQAYSTPAPIAFLSARLAGIDGSTSVYEPAAGNGMLLITADPENAVTNELNDERAANLRKLGFNPTQRDSTEWAPDEPVDAATMNPPFGRLRGDDGKIKPVKYDGYTIKSIDHLMAARSLEPMRDDGRATLIIGANKVVGEISPSDRTFFNWLYSHYNVTDHFEIDGDLYKRQGAGWPIRVITIEGRQQSKSISPKSGTIERLENWEQIYDRYAESVDSRRDGTIRTEGPVDQSGTESAEAGAGTRPDGGQAAAANGRGGRGSAGNRAGTGSRRGGGSAATDRDQGEGGSDLLGEQSGEPDQRGDGRDLAEGDRGRDPGAQPADADRADGGAGRKRRPVKGSASGFQAQYQTRSKGFNEAVLTPRNMAEATQTALESIEEAVGGDIDQYVADKLGYASKDELFDAFMGLQVDAVASAIYNIENKNAGTIIADQTGVGKGRQAAAMIRYALRQGKTPIFVTEKPNLFTDMYGDLQDIGQKDVRPLILNQDAYITSGDGEPLFKNPTRARHVKAMKSVVADGELPTDRNMLFMTYSQVNKVNLQRDVVEALKGDAMFILDEAHNVAGERETVVKEGGESVKKATTAGFMYEQIADAPVVYLSATYAKRPDNMPIYYRTDIMEAVDSEEELVSAVAAGGVPLQSVMSGMLAESGQLFRRERSFEGITIKTDVDYDNGPTHARLADQVTEGLRAVVDADKVFEAVYFENFAGEAQEAGGDAILVGNKAASSIDHGNFASVVHNYVRQLLLAVKAEKAAKDAIALHKAGKKPVIALENTMESFLKDFSQQLGLAPGDVVTADYRDILFKALERTRRIKIKDEKGDDDYVQVFMEDLDPITRQAYEDAQNVIAELDVGDLPLSPIDYIRTELEKAGLTVSEITGRDMRIDYSGDAPTLMKRDPKEKKDRRATIDAFNSLDPDGNSRLDALIFNAAGATGLSIHASERFTDQKPRHMLVAQPMLDVNVLVQALGRINRTGQVELPEYTMMGLDLPAEKRPLAMTARKMKSLNANTSANSDSDTSLKVPDMLNKYGDQVVDDYLKNNSDIAYMVNMSAGEEEGASGKALKFTGRMALLPVDLQLEIYEEIEGNYNTLIDFLNKTGQNDLEAQTIDLDAKIKDSKIVYEGKNPDTIFGGNTTMHKVNAKYQGKPPRPEEVAEAIDKGLESVSSPEELADSMIVAREQDTGFLEDMERRVQKVQEDVESLLVNGQPPPNDHKNFKKWEGTMQRLEELQGRIKELEQIEARTREMIDRFQVGRRARLDLGDEIVTGVVVGVKDSHKPGKGNPWAPSKVQVSFMVNSGIRQIDLPLTQLEDKKEIFKEMLVGRGKEGLEEVFKTENLTGERREIRYVATGNLIAGSAKLDGGRIVNFTDTAGKTHQGILMPRKYSRGKKAGAFEQLGADQNVPIREPEVMLRFLRNERDALRPSGGVFSANHAVRLMPKGENWELIVPKANKDQAAKSVKFDQALRQAMGTDFYGSGKTMVARFDDARLDQVMRRLMAVTPMYTHPRTRDALVKAGGKPPPLPAQSFDGKDGTLETRSTRGAFARYTDLGDEPGTVAQAIKDAGHILGFDSPFDVVHTRIDKQGVPMRFDLNSRIIEVQEGLAAPRWQMAQWMVEEVLHGVDVVAPRRTISATSPLFSADGAVREEAQRAFEEGSPLAEHLHYPMSEQYQAELSDGEVRAELFARLGVLYLGDPQLMKEVLPNAYRVYHEIFGLEKSSPVGDQYVFGKLPRRPGERTRAREIRREHAPERGAGGAVQGAGGERRAREGLAEIRKAVVRSSGGKLQGARITFGRVNAPGRAGLPSNDQPGSPAYLDTRSADAVMADKLGLGPEQKQSFLSTIRGLKDGAWKQTLGNLMDNVYEGAFDGLIGIRRAEDAVGRGIANQEHERSGYVGARLATGIADMMHAIMHYGAPEWRNGVPQHRPGTRGILDIFSDLGDDLDNWLGWMAAKRGAELMEEGRENNLTEDDIRVLQGLARGKEEKFERAKAEYNSINKAMLDFAEEAGLIDPNSRADWESEWYIPFYRRSDSDGVAPLLAPSTRRGLSHQSSGIKRLKGGNVSTNDLLENILTNWNKMVDASMKNMALLKTVDNLQDSEFISDETIRWRQVAVTKSEIAKRIKKDRKLMAEVAKFLGMDGANLEAVANELAKVDDEGFEKLWSPVEPKDKDVIRVQRGGKYEYYRVHDAALLRATTHLANVGYDDPVTRAGRWFKRLLTTGVTAAPDFMARNFIRDAAHAWAINPDGFKFGRDSLKGLRRAINEDESYRALMFAGAAFQGGYVHGTDPNASAQVIRRALESKGLTRRQVDEHMNSILDTPTKLRTALERGWQKYRNVGDKTENANRQATFAAARDNGKSLAQAVFEAKDLMDYSLRGNLQAMVWLTDVVPFLNARLQGLSKLGRAGKSQPKEVGLAVSKIAMFSVALAMLNGNDDRYQELEDWEKDAYWHFWIGDDHWRIPKPFEIGLLAGTIPERIYHTWVADNQPDQKLLQAMAHGVYGTLGFNPLPQAVIPPLEVWANRSFYFNTPIESMGDENMLDQDRYNAYTSNIMVAMGQLGARFGLSPKELQHLWEGYTGTLGAYALNVADMLLRIATTGDVERPSWRMRDLPVARSFYRGDDPARSTQFITDFYDRMEEVNMILGSIRERMKQDPAGARALLQKHREKVGHRRSFNRVAQRLTELRNLRSRVLRSNVVSERKRREVDRINSRINELARKVAEMAGDAF